MRTESIRLPEKVEKIIKTLQTHGYEAYAVGGCIRDSMLGREPTDWDITTSALPEEVKKLYPRTVDTGIEHGTVTVIIKGEGFEVTTYRIDGKYLDGRHPSEVSFTRNLSEDLRRRDFTINAMAYNHSDGLQDLFGGRNDLERGIVRCVGNPDDRLTEDALRILRGIRFSAQLGFDLDGETKEAMRRHAIRLKDISAERIQVELVEILTSPHPEMMREAWELGITGVILPEFDRMMETEQETPHHKYNVGEHSIRVMENIQPEVTLRLTALMHDIGKPDKKTIDQEGVAHFKRHAESSENITREIMRRLKFDNHTRTVVERLVRYHDYRMPASDKNVRRAISRIGEDIFPEYLKVRLADTLAQSEYEREKKLSDIEKIKKIYEEILKKGECTSLKDLAVSGKDLIDHGMKPGKDVGEKLKELLDLVLDHPELNTKEELLKHI